MVLTFLDRLSHHALPKNRKRETLDACISRKLVLEPCGQFPVTQLTSGEIVDFRKTRLHPKKKWRPKWNDVTLIWLKYPASAKNIITKANGKNFYLIGSFQINGKI